MPKESIKIGLVCDGTSDYGIQHAVDWLMAQHFDNVPYRFLIAKQVIPARGPLGERLRKAVELYLPDILICHRDSEGGDFTVRNAEIEQAANGLLTPVVKAVPSIASGRSSKPSLPRQIKDGDMLDQPGRATS